MTAQRIFPISAPLAALTMIGAVATLSACAAPPVAQAPPPPALVARPAPPPPPENWMDAPRTAGDWSYAQDGADTLASYAVPGKAPMFTLRCNPARRQIALIRALPRPNGEEVPMRILTETSERMLDARPVAASVSQSWAYLAAGDPLLEAMAFSKGRFAVELPGLETLYLPSWIEVSHVIEDCR